MLLCSLTSALVPGALSRDGQGIPMCPATQLIEACERRVAMEETPTWDATFSDNLLGTWVVCRAHTHIFVYFFHKILVQFSTCLNNYIYT